MRLPDTGEAEREVARLARRAADAIVAARARELAAGAARDDAARALGELEAVTETGPAVPGYTTARHALANAGIAARSLYELLEPATGATPASLAAIEALAGHDVLGALVVEADHRARAREIVAGVAPAVRIVCSTPGAAQLPAWCAGVLASDDETALAALAAALAQPAAFGELAAPRPGGDVELRGLGFRVHAAAPVLLGVEARRRAHADRVERARADLAERDRSLEQAGRRVAAAETTGAGVERLERALRAAAGAAINAAWHAAAAADHRVELAARVIAEADARTIEAGNRLAAVEVDLAALRARVAGVDLDELERRLAALRVASESARTAWADLLGRKATAEAVAALADGRARAATERIGSLEPQLAEAERELRTCLAAIGSELAQSTTAELAHYVRVTQRGDTFRSIETLRQRIADVERTTEAAADELERDGSRGVRCLAYASRFGLVYDRARNHIEDRRSQPIAGVLAELERSILDQRSVINERTRELMDTLVMGELARHLQGQIHHLYETIRGINRVLGGLRFGPSEYQFQVTPRADRIELVELVRRLSILDEDSRRQFRAWIDARLDELRAGDDVAVPALLDYRQWFDYKLRMSTTDAAGVELTHRLRQVGSGGEQGVPNYLLVLALGKLMFDAADASVRPMLFDEAFYGIDAGRRDQLLRLATDLGLQLFVASPDQDGVTPAVRAATTLFVVKDANHDVHLAPYHYWNRPRDDQPGLFDAPAPSDDLAECRTDPHPPAPSSSP
ncbi:MAG TPA: SbcC/MukB-like Walker B domain-containing protein [Kofleriaceae bacterium]|nr:SbcC/MukB-like Walker B domain-containing protein [Kofleriaceae bacterium]